MNVVDDLLVTRWFLVFLAVLIALPIPAFTISGIQIPLSDFALTLGFYCYIKRAFKPEGIALTATVLLSLLSSFFIMVQHFGVFNLRPVLSIAFFYKPLLAYFLGYEVIRGKRDLQRFSTTVVGVCVVFLPVCIHSVLTKYNGMFRSEEGSLNGDFFGLPLYAAFGVNSLASFYFLLLVVVVIYLVLAGASKIKYLAVSVALVLSYLIVLSASREATLALLVFYAVLMFVCFSRWPKLRIFAFAVGAVGLFFVFTSDHMIFIWGNKFRQILTALEDGDLNHLASGRIDLYVTALQQLSKNVWAGTGFHGYQLFVDVIDGVGYAEGLSPHNQYITALWKAGILGFIPYVTFLLLVLLKPFNGMPSGMKKVTVALYLAVLLVMNSVWDLFMVANFGALFFFLIGAFARLNEEKSW